MTQQQTLRALLGIAGVVLVASCGSSDTPIAAHENGHKGWDPGTGSIFGTGGVSLFGGKNGGAQEQASGVGVNAYLWRGALDTLSFMPLVSADPFGGVIITDWYQPPAAGGERFKATAYILGRQLRADGVRVSVFRQVLDGGQWVDSPVNSSTATELEDKVLARARDLRAQTAQN